MELDPITGAVVQFRACTPRDFGVSAGPNEPICVIDFKPKPDPNARMVLQRRSALMKSRR